MKTWLNQKKLKQIIQLINHKSPKFNFKLKKGFFNMEAANKNKNLKNQLSVANKK